MPFRTYIAHEAAAAGGNKVWICYADGQAGPISRNSPTPPLCTEEELDDIAGALYALEDPEFAQLRTGWQTTRNGYDWTLAEMGMLVSEPDRLRKLSLAARGLDPTLPWDEDEDPEESPSGATLDRMNAQTHSYLLMTSAEHRVSATKCEDEVWLEQQRVHCSRALKHELTHITTSTSWRYFVRAGVLCRIVLSSWTRFTVAADRKEQARGSGVGTSKLETIIDRRGIERLHDDIMREVPQTSRRDGASAQRVFDEILWSLTDHLPLLTRAHLQEFVAAQPEEATGIRAAMREDHSRSAGGFVQCNPEDDSTSDSDSQGLDGSTEQNCSSEKTEDTVLAGEATAPTGAATEGTRYDGCTRPECISEEVAQATGGPPGAAPAGRKTRRSARKPRGAAVAE